MQRKQKEQTVTALHDTLGGMNLMVITHQTGMTVAELTTLRRRMRDAGAGFRVTKNRLAKIAIDGTPFAATADLFRGPTAIAFSRDPVAAAKVASDYANENAKLVIIGGALGERKLDAEEVKALARLPSLDELRARLVGMIQTPATRVASVLAAPAGQLARVFGAYGSKENAT